MTAGLLGWIWNGLRKRCKTLSTRLECFVLARVQKIQMYGGDIPRTERECVSSWRATDLLRPSKIWRILVQ